MKREPDTRSVSGSPVRKGGEDVTDRAERRCCAWCPL